MPASPNFCRAIKPLHLRVNALTAKVRTVLQSLVSFGAPERILVDSKPHLGTDRMVTPPPLRGVKGIAVQRDANYLK